MIIDFGREIEKPRLVLEGSAGEAVCWGGEGGGVILLEFEDFAGEHSVNGSARRSEGGGGCLKATASTADPQHQGGPYSTMHYSAIPI